MTRISGSGTAFKSVPGVEACCANERLGTTISVMTVVAGKIQRIAWAAGGKKRQLKLDTAHIQNSPTGQFCHGQHCFNRDVLPNRPGTLGNQPSPSLRTGAPAIERPRAIVLPRGPRPRGTSGQALSSAGRVGASRASARAPGECAQRRVTKDELFQQSDIVTIHLILSDRTRGLVGAADLALMKPTYRAERSNECLVLGGKPDVTRKSRKRRV
jgi:D-isomer specific 2-hydroxyacid dehydrogenase, NAD binding domain